MTSLIKKLLSIFQRPKVDPPDQAINSPIIDIKSNPVGKYYKHKVMNNYVYIYGPLSNISNTVFEYIDEATIIRLNQLGLEDLLNQFIRNPPAIDYSSYHYYPRSCMGALQINDIEDQYILVDIYTANLYCNVFVNNCASILQRFDTLKNHAIEIISNENLTPTIDPGPYRGDRPEDYKSTLLDPNYNRLNDEQIELLNINRFDRID